MVRNPRKVILGVTWGVGEELVRPFLLSLEDAGYDGRVIVIASRTGQRDIDTLRTRCEVLEVDEQYPIVVPRWIIWALRKCKTTKGLRRHYPTAFGVAARVLRARPGSPAARDLEFRLQGLQALRYEHYRQFLGANPDVELVMISDLRDVVLQSDPFDGLSGIEVYLEDEATSFAHPGFNATWVEELFGPDTLRSMRGTLASCSGVTIGERQPMLDYLAAMAGEVAKHVIPLGPRDQAIHNYLLFTGALPFAERVANGEGRVVTLGLNDEVHVSDDGTVLNPDGTMPSVVHQYDRFPGLADQVRQRLEGRGSPR